MGLEIGLRDGVIDPSAAKGIMMWRLRRTIDMTIHKAFFFGLWLSLHHRGPLFPPERL